ncbi:MAG: hypothetical protein KJ058_10940 [Thermoanaerobaculia bacterium]|nr:hypothetical protein [Thermoanaerobaculia bacterium]MCZ7651402.1 hypothetical protein [Thermoanaerobaculia bacterium]
MNALSPPSASPAPAAAPPESDAAYASVEAPDAWHVLSLVCFAGSLAGKPIARAIAPLFPPMRYLWAALPVAVTLALSLLGALLALVGMRRAAIRGASRLALFLNGTVLALTLLAAAFGLRILLR